MTLEEIKQRISENKLMYLRFVRVNSKYRFSDAAAYGLSTHLDLSQGEPVESAGFVKIHPDGFIVEGGSMILGIGCDRKDEPNLERLFDLSAKNPW